MPKPFSLLVTVEEIALGPVMARLQSIPGILSVDMVPRKSAANGHANGHANGEDKKPAKPPYQGDETGEKFVLRLLKKGPMKAAAIQAAFEKEGRSPGSYASQVWTMKNDGLVQQKEERGPYALTKKGRDRARAV